MRTEQKKGEQCNQMSYITPKTKSMQTYKKNTIQGRKKKNIPGQ
jgi:hypothetical protein